MSVFAFRERRHALDKNGEAMKLGMVVTLLATLAIMAIMVGCAHGPIEGKYPPAYSAPEPATIVVGRRSEVLGSGVNVGVSIEGEEAYRLSNGEQIEFKVDPGEHYFGAISVDSLFRPTHHEIPVFCEPGQDYFFLVEMHLWIPPTIEAVRDLQLLSSPITKR